MKNSVKKEEESHQMLAQVVHKERLNDCQI